MYLVVELLHLFIQAFDVLVLSVELLRELSTLLLHLFVHRS